MRPCLFPCQIEPASLPAVFWGLIRLGTLRERATQYFDAGQIRAKASKVSPKLLLFSTRPSVSILATPRPTP